MATIRELKDYKEELLDQNEKSLKHIKVLSVSLKEYVVNNNQKLARLSSRLEKIRGEQLHY